MGGGGGGGGIACSATVQYTGTPSETPAAAPLRGNVGCVDIEVQAMRDTVANPIRNNQDAANIYGPMEAGFTSAVPNMACLGDNVISGGIDTNLAEHMVEFFCPGTDIQVLDVCGGHAMPYHYHERMTCLYTADPTTGHSTRIGTAGDGNGIYGKYIDGGVEPTDLDACGGRFGVTPDSNGAQVYYYPVKATSPFSIGCYGPVASVQECRDLYPNTCGDGATVQTVTTIYGTGQYTLDCPCYDENESNVLGQGRPEYLAPLTAATPTAATTSSPTVSPSTPAPVGATPTDTEPPVTTVTPGPVAAAPTDQPTPAPAVPNNGPHIMLNTDIALVRDLTDNIDTETGEPSCSFRGGGRCPLAAQTLAQAGVYRANNDIWLADFKAAFVKMINKNM